MPPGQAAIVLWDARATGHSGVLTRLQMHSSRLAVVASTMRRPVPSWASRLQHRQIVAVLALPATQAELSAALASARRRRACVLPARRGFGCDSPVRPRRTASPGWCRRWSRVRAARSAGGLGFLRHTERQSRRCRPCAGPSTP